jgi:pyrroloquinoline-quinone synthase
MHRLDAIVSRYDLNQHPFYRAWREGALPRAALASYAADYAPFIHAVEGGWRCLGDEGHAATERAHAKLWDDFRFAIGPATEPASAGSHALSSEARAAFASADTALGALYAFEAQQPRTAKSKLDGLRLHYALGEKAEAYFAAHAEDYGEREELSLRAHTLAPSELTRAEAACEGVCKALWSMLDGVMEHQAACA